MPLCPMVNDGFGCTPYQQGQVDSGVLLAGTILHFAALVILVVAAVWLLNRLVEAWGRRRVAPPSPLGELDLAYARGALNRDDYLTRRADLMAAAGYAAPAYPVPPVPSVPPPSTGAETPGPTPAV